MRTQASSVSAQACSPSAQVKAAAAHAWTLKRRQKKILKPVYGGRTAYDFPSLPPFRLAALLFMLGQ